MLGSKLVAALKIQGRTSRTDNVQAVRIHLQRPAFMHDSHSPVELQCLRCLGVAVTNGIFRFVVTWRNVLRRNAGYHILFCIIVTIHNCSGLSSLARKLSIPPCSTLDARQWLDRDKKQIFRGYTERRQWYNTVTIPVDRSSFRLYCRAYIAMIHHEMQVAERQIGLRIGTHHFLAETIRFLILFLCDKLSYLRQHFFRPRIIPILG